MSRAKELDQFFTTYEMADECSDTLIPLLDGLGYERMSFLEPSAGDGSFMDAMQDKGYQVVASDVDPKRDDVISADFLEDDLTAELPSKQELVVIGNPPFGKRSKLAVGFINKSLSYADTVAFVLPIQFMKYLTQKRMNPQAQLIHNEIIDPDSFTFEDKPYSVRCVFQVWTTRKSDYPDLRTRMKPATKHEDFELYIYNCVPQALYMFDLEWDFAVHRQGWTDFQPINKEEAGDLNRKKQWMFFKSDNPEVLERLKSIDYNKLGEKNTSVRGFGKADVVEEYVLRYGVSLGNNDKAYI